jgi:SNF2 family DNA or RNA helicase
LSTYFVGTEVEARGLRWEIVDVRAMGDQTLLRLRGLEGIFARVEVDVLTPFERVRPMTHEFQVGRPTQLANWRTYQQAFLLQQALGPNAFASAHPGRLLIEPYQLVPVARALRMIRPRLLLADDVGLGKTAEAGLVIAELMARRRAARVLIVSPAGPLLAQWKSEMLERFGLLFTHVDRFALDTMRRTTELGANPLDFIPLALASMDYLKQEKLLDLLERALPYDIVVMDEFWVIEEC